jgi:hypothetical protein
MTSQKIISRIFSKPNLADFSQVATRAFFSSNVGAFFNKYSNRHKLVENFFTPALWTETRGNQDAAAKISHQRKDKIPEGSGSNREAFPQVGALYNP